MFVPSFFQGVGTFYGTPVTPGPFGGCLSDVFHGPFLPERTRFMLTATRGPPRFIREVLRKTPTCVLFQKGADGLGALFLGEGETAGAQDPMKGVAVVFFFPGEARRSSEELSSWDCRGPAGMNAHEMGRGQVVSAASAGMNWTRQFTPHLESRNRKHFALGIKIRFSSLANRGARVSNGQDTFGPNEVIFA